MTTSPITKKTIESRELAKKLHEWYLEASKKIGAESFNIKAQKSFDELTEEQKFLDEFIAERVIEFFEKK